VAIDERFFRNEAVPSLFIILLVVEERRLDEGDLFEVLARGTGTRSRMRWGTLVIPQVGL
jgi:hypothetical protein